MFKGKSLTDFININKINIGKKNGWNTPNHRQINTYPKWNNPMQFRRNEIKEKNYFIAKICERETTSKTLKHIAAFDYVDKALLVSSATSGGVSIASLSTVADANTYWNQSWKVYNFKY